MKQLELANELQRASHTSIISKNIVGSKIYQDLEAHYKKLQVDVAELRNINGDLLKQIESLTNEKNAAISDVASV